MRKSKALISWKRLLKTEEIERKRKTIMNTKKREIKIKYIMSLNNFI